MKGGTLVLGGAELRTGAWMMRGTIISLTPIPLLPTFAFDCSYNPTFLRVLARHLSAYVVALPYASHEGSYRLYNGDSSVSRKGEVLVWEPRAS